MVLGDEGWDGQSDFGSVRMKHLGLLGVTSVQLNSHNLKLPKDCHQHKI